VLRFLGSLPENVDRVVFWMLASALLFAVLATLLERWYRKRKKCDAEKLFELSRLLRKSEYDLFFIASRSWNLPEPRVRGDFKRYLLFEEIPFYVRDFIRANEHCLSGA